MSRIKLKVLVLATSQKTRGGITSVVQAHKLGEQWGKYQCKWIETHIDKGGLWKLIYFLKSFFQYLFLLPKCDLVHIHTSEPPSALRKIPFTWYARLFRKKIIIHFHAFSAETTIHSKYKRLYQYLFSKANIVLVLSESWKRELSQTFELDDKVSVLYNPSSDTYPSKIYSKQKYILYAGTVTDRKGYADLIQAFAAISSKYLDWKVVIAGNGEIEKGKKLAQSLNIENQILFLGWVSGNNKIKAFQEASIFCLPSYAEGFPMAVLDAWTFGLPVITTPVGGLPDVLIDGENALVFNPGEIDKLSAALTRMIEEKELRERLTKNSDYLIKTKFKRDIINKQLEYIYNSLLGK